MRAAPIELIELGLDPEQFRKAGPDEWHGPCPHCGGKDRFRVLTAKAFPHWYWVCRKCNRKGWADQLNDSLRQPFTQAEREKWAADQRVRELKQAEDRTKRLAEFTSEELWAELHNRMAEEQRHQWETWGIPVTWQNYLELGYTAHYSKSLDTPAYTIPYFHHTEGGKQFSTMQYRLMGAPNPLDRYRFAAGLPSTYYETMPTEPMKDTAIICEGVKKAANLRIRGGKMFERASILAVPSKTGWGGVEQAVKDCGKVFVLLDPDGTNEARELALEIGSQARVIGLHVKVDDGILNGWLGESELLAAFRCAARVQ